MRHWKLVIAACGALGFATSLGVAWLLAVVREIPMYPATITASVHEHEGRVYSSRLVRMTGVTDNWWMDMSAQKPGVPTQQVIDEYIAYLTKNGKAIEPPVRWGSFSTGSDLTGVGTQSADIAYGLPARCMWLRVSSDASGNTLVGEELQGGLHFRGTPSSRGRDFRAIPLWVMWPGLLVNFAVYTSAWFLLCAGVVTLRGVLRRRRGGCEQCGYDRRGLGNNMPCPECGGASRRVSGVVAKSSVVV